MGIRRIANPHACSMAQTAAVARQAWNVASRASSNVRRAWSSPMVKRMWKVSSKRWKIPAAVGLFAIMSDTASADLLDDALSRYSKVETYQVTLRSSASHGGPFREIIRYAFKQPGWVRMDFSQPYSGMVLIYDPEKNRVRLWPWGSRGPDFSLSPDNW